jgi:hypothetical protein
MIYGRCVKDRRKEGEDTTGREAELRHCASQKSNEKEIRVGHAPCDEEHGPWRCRCRKP